MRKTKEQKRIDNLVEASFYRHAQNVQIPVLDLSKVHAAGVAAAQAGGDIDAAMIAAIAQYRRN